MQTLCDPSELVEWAMIDVLTSEAYAICQQDFESFDSDISGLLERKEIPKLLKKQLEREPTESEVQAYMRENDINKDGKISLVEYIGSIYGKDWRIDGDEAGDICPKGLHKIGERLSRSHDWGVKCCTKCGIKTTKPTPETYSQWNKTKDSQSRRNNPQPKPRADSPQRPKQRPREVCLSTPQPKPTSTPQPKPPSIPQPNKAYTKQAVSPPHSKEADSDFMALDANQDGFLSQTELHCSLSDLGFSEDDISALIVKLDVNNDGKIAKQEFVANYGSNSHVSESGATSYL